MCPTCNFLNISFSGSIKASWFLDFFVSTTITIMVGKEMKPFSSMQCWILLSFASSKPFSDLKTGKNLQKAKGYSKFLSHWKPFFENFQNSRKEFSNRSLDCKFSPDKLKTGPFFEKKLTFEEIWRDIRFRLCRFF